jgi:hypothetical protein
MLFLFESPCAYQILPASWCVGVVSLAVRGVEQIASQPRNFLSLGQRSCMAYVPSSTYFLKVKCFQYRHKNTTAPRDTNHCCFSCSCETSPSHACIAGPKVYQTSGVRPRFDGRIFYTARPVETRTTASVGTQPVELFLRCLSQFYKPS